MLAALERVPAATSAALGGASVRLQVVGNLAALLLEAGRPAEALQLLEQVPNVLPAAPASTSSGRATGGARSRGAQRVDGEGVDAAAAGHVAGAPDALCGMRFNRAKALSALGRLAEAQQGYEDAARHAAGQDAACFAKVGGL